MRRALGLALLVGVAACGEPSGDLDASCAGAGCADAGASDAAPAADAGVGWPRALAVSLECAAVDTECGDPSPALAPCDVVRFSGEREIGETCARRVVLVARRAAFEGARVEVVSASVRLEDLNVPDVVVEDAFELTGDEGETLPLQIDVPAGGQEVRLPMWLTFDGSPGLLRGREEDGRGARLVFSAGGDTREQAFNVLAVGRSAILGWGEGSRDLIVEAVGTPVERSIELRNLGDGTLRITGLTVTPDDGELQGVLHGGLPSSVPPFGIETMTLSYRPISTALRRWRVELESNAVAGPTSIEVRAGRWPRLNLTSPQGFIFAPARSMRSLGLRNVGTATLSITRLEIVGPDGSPGHPAAQRFRLRGCGEVDCAPPFSLCAPGRDGCRRSEAELSIELGLDLPRGETTLVIESDDPIEPERRVPLRTP